MLPRNGCSSLIPPYNCNFLNAIMAEGRITEDVAQQLVVFSSFHSFEVLPVKTSPEIPEDDDAANEAEGRVRRGRTRRMNVRIRKVSQCCYCSDDVGVDEVVEDDITFGTQEEFEAALRGDVPDLVTHVKDLRSHIVSVDVSDDPTEADAEITELLEPLFELLYDQATDIDSLLEICCAFIDMLDLHDRVGPFLNSKAAVELQNLLGPRLTNEDLFERSVTTLGKIADHDPEARNQVIELGIMTHLMDQFVSQMPDVCLRRVRTTAWVFHVFTRPWPPRMTENAEGDEVLSDVPWPETPEMTIAKMLPAVLTMMEHRSSCIKVDGLRVVNNVLHGCGARRVEMIIDADILPVLAKLLASDLAPVLRGALQAINGIVEVATDGQLKTLLDTGLLEPLLGLLEHEKQDIVFQALHFLSSATTPGAEDAVFQAILDAGILPAVVRLLGDQEASFKVRCEAAWMVSNLAHSNSQELVKALVKDGVIGPLCDMLNCKDVEVVASLLDGLNKIITKTSGSEERNDIMGSIEDCGGLKTLADLEQSEGEIVSNAASVVLNNFSFPCDSSMDTTMSDVTLTSVEDSSDETMPLFDF